MTSTLLLVLIAGVIALIAVGFVIMRKAAKVFLCCVAATLLAAYYLGNSQPPEVLAEAIAPWLENIGRIFENGKELFRSVVERLSETVS